MSAGRRPGAHGSTGVHGSSCRRSASCWYGSARCSVVIAARPLELGSTHTSESATSSRGQRVGSRVCLPYASTCARVRHPLLVRAVDGGQRARSPPLALVSGGVNSQLNCRFPENATSMGACGREHSTREPSSLLLPLPDASVQCSAAHTRCAWSRRRRKKSSRHLDTARCAWQVTTMSATC